MCIWHNRESSKVIRIRKAKLLKWKYCKTEETFLEYKKATINIKSKLREIKHKNWKSFCDAIDKFTNPLYICDRMKNENVDRTRQRELEYEEKLVISAEKTFESYVRGADEPTRAPAFDHDNQDSFLDSDCTSKELNFAIKNLSPGHDEIDYLIILNLPNEGLEILLEIYNHILRARMSQTSR